MPVPRQRWVDEPACAQTVLPSWLCSSMLIQARKVRFLGRTRKAVQRAANSSARGKCISKPPFIWLAAGDDPFAQGKENEALTTCFLGAFRGLTEACAAK